MYNNTRRISFILIAFILFCAAVFGIFSLRVETQEFQTTTYITPATLDDQKVYPTRHIFLPLNAWIIFQWKSISIPDSWVGKGYWFEIWDQGNRKIPGFGAKKIETSSLNLSLIDPTLYPKIRLIIFKPDNVPDLPYNIPVKLTCK